MIKIRNEQKKFGVNEADAKRVARKVLDRMGAAGASLSILFVDDRKMRALNREFLGKDEATDCLSFSMREGKALKGESKLLGDIAISLETADRQARRFRTSLQQEVCLYLIHGILHLLGFDDRKKKARAKMEKLQAKLLTQINTDST